MSSNFAFLVLEEHPYGREMLRILLENGFTPTLISKLEYRILSFHPPTPEGAKEKGT